MGKINEVWRQGDVVVLRGMPIPEAAKPVQHDGVLALGEVTGHKHQVIGKGVKYFMDDKRPGVLHFNVPRFATLNHGIGMGKANLPTEKREDDPETIESKEEGHFTHDLPAGDYVRVTQNEYDWVNEALRPVED